MKRKVILFIIAGTMTVAHTLSAQQANPAQESKPVTFNLQECLRYALQNSYEVHKAKFDAEEANAQHSEAKGALLPQVNGSVSATNNLRLPVTYMPGDFFGAPEENIGIELGVKYSTVAGIELEQVVFDAGLFTGMKMSRNARELAELKKSMTQEELIYNIGNAFYDIVYSQNLLKSNIETLVIMDSIYRKMELRVAQNIIRDIELNRMKVNVGNMKVDIRKTFATLTQQKNYLKVLMGMPLEYDFEVEETIQPILLSQSLPANGNYDISNRIELQILDNERKANLLEIKQLRQSYLPALSLFASYSYNFENEQFNVGNSRFWSNGVYFGAKLSVPIFDGGVKHHKMRQSRVRLEKADEEIKLQQQNMLNELHNARLQMQVSYESAGAQRENMEVAEKSYRQSVMLYHEGLYSITDLLDTEKSYREAQAAYTYELVNYLKSTLDVKKSEGTLGVLLN